MNALLDHTELIDFGRNITTEGVNLPLPMYGHCLVRIDDFVIMLIGGMSKNGVLSQTWFIYYGEWIVGPEIKHPRYLHSCGLQQNKVVISGGRNEDDLEMDSVEMLDVTSSSSEWISGKY